MCWHSGLPCARGISFAHSQMFLRSSVPAPKECSLNSFCLSARLFVVSSEYGYVIQAQAKQVLMTHMQILPQRRNCTGASRARVGVELDIWAVGILAYELMLGGPPFESDTKEETYDKILHDDPYYPSLWTGEAKDFLNQASPFGSLPSTLRQRHAL